MSLRKIIHIDMDAFFASVEQRDFPEYRGKPLIVGGRSNRGVVSAASYEARKYGIHSAMPVQTALKRCPHVINQSGRMHVYKEVSEQIQSIFREYSDLVEPLSLDEAFIDVTHPKKGPASASLIAQEIRQRIFEKTQLIASAGVSYNKFLAKIASDMDKPDGFFVILPNQAEHFLEDLKIEKFFGIGKVTAKRFHKIGIHTGADLRALDRSEITRLCGKTGLYLYNAVRGIDERPVNSHWERKSVATERTFSTDIHTTEEVNVMITKIADEAWNRQLRSKKHGKTLTLKVKYADFKSVTRRRTFDRPVDYEQILPCLLELMPYEQIEQKGCRLLGVSFSGFEVQKYTANIQLKLNFNKGAKNNSPKE